MTCSFRNFLPCSTFIHRACHDYCVHVVPPSALGGIGDIGRGFARYARDVLRAALVLYALGFVGMFLPLMSARVDGWSAFAVWLVGVAAFVAGLALEERGYRQKASTNS